MYSMPDRLSLRCRIGSSYNLRRRNIYIYDRTIDLLCMWCGILLYGWVESHCLCCRYGKLCD